MQVAARTDVGHVRTRNEDALLVLGSDGVVAVFDGLGGHPDGDVASATAADAVRAAAGRAAGSREELVAVLQGAHEAVLAEAGDDPARQGMATTVVAATLRDGRALVAHVGDSRAYLLDPDGQIRQITEDHGVGGYISQALGLDRGVAPDVVEVTTPPGSRLLLCSDGLSNMVGEPEISQLLAAGDAEAACDALVETALAHGGIDNVTVVVAVF